MSYELILGDCLEILPTLEAGSIDAILTDLPYGVTNCNWDAVIPFEVMWAQVKRVLKPRGVFVTTAIQPFTSALVMSNPDWFKYCLVWEKAHAANFLSAHHMPLMKHEDIVVFCSATPTYNAQVVRGSAKRNRSGGVIAERQKNSIYGTKPSILAEVLSTEYQPSSVQFFSAGAMCERLHPTQKPVALYAYLIRTYTNPGDTVLDFCAGSFTTGVACLETGRNFIGIEKDEHYFKVAEKRLADAAAQPMLFEVTP